MRKSLLLLIIAWVGHILAAQAQIVKWAKEPTGTYSGYGYHVATGPSGNVFTTGLLKGAVTFGATTLTGTAYYNYHLAKYDTAGVCQWTKLLDSTISILPLQSNAPGEM